MLRQTALLIGLVAIVGVATSKYGRYSRRHTSYGASDGVACPDRKRQCHPDALCLSEAGRDKYKTQYRCQCKPGYSGNGYSCTDIDECVENTHNCDDNANCTNTAGGFTCACREGFTTCGACCKAIPPPTTPPPPATPSSCKAILENDTNSQTGLYTIRLEGATADIQVYCDMTREGGGWTLVYSYWFTDFQNFLTVGNAVTPRPNWPNVIGDDVSTTIPTGLWVFTDPGAMDSADWAKIGSEFLILSTVNNGIRCSPGTGSLVTFTDGTINCTVVNFSGVGCIPTAPDGFRNVNGLHYELYKANTGASYVWDNSVTAGIPVHATCIGDDDSYNEPLADTPGASIFLR